MSNFSEFKSFSKVRNERTKYILDEDLEWDIGVKNSGWKLVISKGTKFDISVPRYLEWFLNPHDEKILLAAVVHDELLILGHDAAFASSEFRRAAIVRGVKTSRAWMLFLTTFFWTVKWK